MNTLALAHWDVEHMEESVLRGAVSTISRDRPWFTIEAHLPQSDACEVRRKHLQNARSKVHLVREMGYSTYVLDENCGMPVDCGCRNILCVPRESVPQWTASAIYQRFRPLLSDTNAWLGAGRRSAHAQRHTATSSGHATTA